MKKHFYPLLEDFISNLKNIDSGLILEDEEAGKISDDEIRKLRGESQKLADQEAAVSPYTGKTVNVKMVAEEIEKIKYKITTQSQLYRPYVNEMSPTIFTWVIKTMATDGVRLFVNPEFAATLSFLGKIFVIIHEIMHCILMHGERGKGFDHEIFNIAADFEINTIMVDTTDDFTADFVKNEIHGLYDEKYLNLPVEEIYQDLLKNPPQLPPPPSNAAGQPQFGDGQGQGQEGQEGQEGGDSGNTEMKKNLQRRLADGDKGRSGQIIDKSIGEQIAKAEGYSDEEARIGEDKSEKWRENARNMIKDFEKLKASGQARGGALVTVLGKLLKPVVKWKSLLKAYVGTALSPEKEWRIGAKKHLHKSDQYLKRGLRQKKDAIKKAFIVVDASGSMFSKSGNVTIFDRVISEISYIITSKKIREIYVLFFDGDVDPNATQIVKRQQKIFKPDLSSAALAGGTNFQAPLNYIKAKYHDAVNLLIFLTDGYAESPQKPKYANKFIWLVYDNPDWQKPFGRAIKIDMQDM